MKKSGRGRGPYPPQFRREAVELYRSSGKSLRVIAEELGISIESLRAWNKQFEVDVGVREGISSDEREELREPSHLPFRAASVSPAMTKVSPSLLS